MVCKECPLQELCADRIRIGEYFGSIAEAESEYSYARIESAEDPSPEDIEGTNYHILATAGAIKQSIAAMLLTVDVAAEKLIQICEELECPGPIIERKYRWFGAVTHIECGSDARLERLQYHLTRTVLDSQSILETKRH